MKEVDLSLIFKLGLRLQVESTDTTSVVTVPISLRSHSGRYTITAKNKSGQKRVNVRVIVLGMSVLFKDLNLSLNCCITNLSRFCDGDVVLLGSLTVFFSRCRRPRTSKGTEGHWHHPVDNEADLETPRQWWRRENQELFYREEVCHWQGLDKGEHCLNYFTVCSFLSILVNLYYSYFRKQIPSVVFTFIEAEVKCTPVQGSDECSLVKWAEARKKCT